MGVWLEVFQNGTQVAFVDSTVTANLNERLDEAGTFDLNCVVAYKVVTYLKRDNEIAIYTQEDNEPPTLQLYGVIIKPQVQETGDNVSIRISGRDLMEELRRVTVGLGRTFDAQTMSALMNDMLSLVSGWTLSIETAVASQLQTARFDGPAVLKAILKSAAQKGLHIRNGQNPRVLEVGAFGDHAMTASGRKIRAIMAPDSVSPALYANDAVLLVDSLSVQEDGDNLINWAIPMGAGQGSVATTLKYTSYTIINASDNSIYHAGFPPYFPIYRRVNDAGIEEFYIDASDGGIQHQETQSYSEIGPIANSDTAKILAADALADACIESLKRSRVPLIGYTLSVRKSRTRIRPGQLIHLTYRGVVLSNGPNSTKHEFTYIDVDTDLWVMAVQRNISDSGIATTLQVNTVDQHIKDDTDILVEVLDKAEVKNLSIQNEVNNYCQSANDTLQWNDGDTVHRKTALFPLSIDDEITDIISVKLNFFTKALSTTATFDHYNGLSPTDGSVVQYIYGFGVQTSTHFPQNISLLINNVDVTAELGGPWAPSDAPVNVTLDISPYIINAAGGIYQTHTLEFKCAETDGYDHVYITPNVPGAVSVVNISHGIIYCNTRVRAASRALAPS